MFGYVTINKPELKVKDYYKYKAYYCGLCKTLKEKYGFSGQMTLTYDMTFVIILLTSLYESETSHSRNHCIVHPVKKVDILQNEITEYAAQMNLILSYYHFIDDWKDEKSIAGLTGSRLLHRNIKKIVEKYPKQCKIIRSCLKRLQTYEKDQIMNIDMASGCFGELMGELFLYREDKWSATLRRFGFFLGKYIYIIDAYDDLEEDRKKGNYNPLKQLADQPSYEEECNQMLTMMMAECSCEFEKLPCVLDVDIIRNILYAGVWTKYDKIQKERLDGKEQKNGK